MWTPAPGAGFDFAVIDGAVYDLRKHDAHVHAYRFAQACEISWRLWGCKP